MSFKNIISRDNIIKITIKFENILILFSKYYHLKYTNFEISSYNRNSGYEMTIIAFTTRTAVI